MDHRSKSNTQKYKTSLTKHREKIYMTLVMIFKINAKSIVHEIINGLCYINKYAMLNEIKAGTEEQISHDICPLFTHMQNLKKLIPRK